jgi:CheY-like chemotaxis protein
MTIEPKDLRIAEVQDYFEQTFRHLADQKGIEFEIAAESGVPENMVSDGTRLNQILKNLLSNAFKFTERGKVTFTIRSLAGGARGAMLAFEVKDTGIGIPKDKQNLIFEAFQQADGTTSRKYGGTGLGLTISREIARLLGGRIEVESVPGAGSTFTLVLPETYSGPETARSGEKGPSALGDPSSDPSETPSSEEPFSSEGLAGKKVLVVDDDIRNIFAIHSVLEAQGMKAIHAENGRVGLRLLEENPDVDLILMDTMMPEMDGLSATRAIRKIRGFERLPIVSLTAKAMKGDRENALAAGASDYVTKPVDPEKLLITIRRWLTKAGEENRS